MLNSGEIQRFGKDGYFVIERLLKGEMLERICGAFDRLDGYHNLLD